MTAAEKQRLEIARGHLCWYVLALRAPVVHGVIVAAFGEHDAVAQAQLMGAIDLRPGTTIVATDWPDTRPPPSMVNRRLDRDELLELLDNWG